MKRLLFSIIAMIALATPALAATIFIPTGPKQYTPQPDIIIPQPDIVTPNPDLVTVTPGYYVSTGSKSPADSAVSSDKCSWTAMNGATVRMVNVDANCTPLSIVSHGEGYNVAPVTTRTPQAPTVTPQPDIVIPQPDLCSQPGIYVPGGFGSRDC